MRGETEIPTNLKENERYCRIADGWHIQVSQFTTKNSSDRAIIASTIEEKRENITSKVHTRTRRFSSIPYWQATWYCILQSNLPVVWYRRRRRRANRSWTWAVANDHAKKTEKNATSSKATRWNNALRQQVPGGNWTILCHQWICDGRKQFSSSTWTNTQGQEILKIQDYKQALLDDNIKNWASERNWK